MHKTSLQLFLENEFVTWTPLKPQVINKSHRDVTLKWLEDNGPFGALSTHFLYRISVRDKVPPWRVIYSGGKTSIKINDLASGFFHKFRLQVILKAEAVPELANEFLKHYSKEQSIYEIFSKANTDNIDHLKVFDYKKPITDEYLADYKNLITDIAIDTITSTYIVKGQTNTKSKKVKKTGTNNEIFKEPNRIQSIDVNFSNRNLDKVDDQNVSDDMNAITDKDIATDTINITDNEKGDTLTDKNNGFFEEPNKSNDVKTQINFTADDKPVLNETGDYNFEVKHEISNSVSRRREWLESLWSDEVWVTTDTEGTSAACFCMAVQCGYLKQVQQNLEEKPELVSTLNAVNGRTPLITAVVKGNLQMVTLLLSYGADVSQKSTAGQTALHLAIYHHHLGIAQILLERGANIETCDVNGLGWEHLAVDSCSVESVQFVLEHGGDIEARDSQGWTPLFRAVCQGASDEMIRCLCDHGADINVRDYSGLPLHSIALLLTDKRGQPRESALRLLDANYPREIARGHFTRLTGKINRILKATTLV